jgi:hypothetical protein
MDKIVNAVLTINQMSITRMLLVICATYVQMDAFVMRQVASAANNKHLDCLHKTIWDDIFVIVDYHIVCSMATASVLNSVIVRMTEQ